MPRIPFTMAEPGTDPTRQPNPIRHKRGLNDMVPYGIAIVAFILAGWWFFIRPGDGAKTAQAQPTAAPRATLTAAPTIALPTSTIPPSPTPTPTHTPTPAPTPIPPNILTYAVYQNGEAIYCWCNTETLFWGDNVICQAYLPSDCGGAP